MRLNRNRLYLIAFLAIVVSTTAVLACGPEFPLQLLDDRAVTLQHPPINSFAYEVARLRKPDDNLKAFEDHHDYYSYDMDGESPALYFQRKDLSPEQVELVKQMREANNGDKAFAIGINLPIAVRLYNAGAVDYLSDYELNPDKYTNAERRFKEVLDLPIEEGKSRAVWAAYMIAVHNRFPFLGNNDDAVSGFTLVRKLARDGAPDPMGLAVASYGEEARNYLSYNGYICDWNVLFERPECLAGVSPSNLKRAIALYVEQAIRGSDTGIISLRFIVNRIFDTPKRISAFVDDALTRQVLVAYALTSDVDPQPLMSAIVEREDKNIKGIDRLSVLAYQSGKYDLAKQLADRSNSALASWVRAKLASREGDWALAAQLYAEASRAFPTLDDSVSGSNVALMKGEEGVLTLARGQFVEALDKLYAAAILDTTNQSDSYNYIPTGYVGYYHDMSYIAERVLTLDELKNYVDMYVPASPLPTNQPNTASISQNDFYQWQSQNGETVSDGLRSLLARRLVRMGRMQEAINYFPNDDDLRYARGTYSEPFEVIPQTRRAWTKEYLDGLNMAKSAWTDIGKAEGWYKAARIARIHGMEIMGYEQAPDFTVLDGDYDYGVGRARPYDRYVVITDAQFEEMNRREAARRVKIRNMTEAELAEMSSKEAAQRAEADLPGIYVTEDERHRYAESEAQPNYRFHYRYIAVDLAVKAADLLPPKSQAFGATLCNAARFTASRDSDNVASLYNRYLQENRRSDYGDSFGYSCAVPDFKAAVLVPYQEAWKNAKKWTRNHEKLLAVVLTALTMVLASVMMLRKEKVRC